MMDIHGTCAVIRKQKPLTSGLVGAKVSFRFDSGWEGLAKTAVFRCGDMTKDVLLESNQISIPAEVLQGGLPLEIGVYGTRGSDLAIPTVWAKTAPVIYGTDPSGDPAADPTLPLWAQLRQQVTDNTEALTWLRENMGSGGTGGGAGKSAYEIAKEQGFEGTVTQWLESLKGEQGPQGEQGEPGADAPADTYLPKDGSEPMAGDLSMEGHRLTGLGAPVSDTDAVRKQDVRLAGWMPTAEEVGARPDTWTPTAEEVGAAPATQSSTYPGCYYRMVGGEKEWINPPMVRGVEYRTTERLDNLVKYTKLVDFGAMPANSVKTVYDVVDGSIVSVDGIVFNADGNPFVTFATNQSISSDFSERHVSVQTFYEFSNCTAYLIVKYLKM